MLYLLVSPSVPTKIPNCVPIRKSFLMPLMVLPGVNKLNLPAKVKSGSSFGFQSMLLSNLKYHHYRNPETVL